MRRRVYIAGPLSGGDQANNVLRAIKVGSELIKRGYAPFIPHLSFFVHNLYPEEYETWIAQDFEWLPLCHAVLRMLGESSGADREVALAKSLGIPCYNQIEELFQEKESEYAVEGRGVNCC